MADRQSRALNFRQRDMEAAIRAARRAGIERFRVEAEHGKVVVIIDERDTVPAPEGARGEENEWHGIDGGL